MNKLFFIVLALLITLFSFSACKKDRITGNGNIISETRNTSPFTGVSVNGVSDINIKYGTDYNVVVRGSSNLIPYYATRVVNNVLHLGFENVNVRGGDDIEVEVTLPTIRKVSISGDSDVEIRGAFPLLTSLDVSVSGSGDVEIENSIYGERVNIEISGSGEVDFEKLNVKIAEVNISGSGNAKLQVEESLKARISGSGKVYYRGNPAINQNISGSGKLIKL